MFTRFSNTQDGSKSKNEKEKLKEKKKMVAALVGMVIIALIIAAVCGAVFIDVYKILKLVNHETDVDMVKFDKCILPYKR